MVDIDPPDNRIVSASVYSADATAIAVLTGLYTKFTSIGYGSSVAIPNISLWMGLSADEFTLWTTGNGAAANQLAYYTNNLSVSTGYGTEFWMNAYPVIYSCNAAIEGLNSSNSLTDGVKRQLLGEAKFVRAFIYFYLVNLYGDVPLVLSTDYTANAGLPRLDRAQVYKQIIADLQDAQGGLVDGYVKGDAITLYPVASAERVRPNKAAATALLGRVYLYIGDWVHAEEQASVVINNSSYYSLPTLNNVFVKNSKEAIWQLQPVNALGNTAEATFFNIAFAPSGLSNTHPVYLSAALLAAFESGDQRKANVNWVNSYMDGSGTYYYPYKYKSIVTTLPSGATSVPAVEYTMMLRLGEQYLIRAEARAQQGNVSGAQADINAIRARAFITSNPTTANDKPSLLAAVMHERQVELFSELGHRWLDLKRTSSIDATMMTATQLKGGVWKSYQQLYPLPSYDLSKDGNLLQNPNY